jgi:hypothetical protein
MLEALLNPEDLIMKSPARHCSPFVLVALAWLLGAISLSAQSNAQLPSFGICKPVTERTTELGCWILVDHPLGKIDQGEVFWYLDTYPAREDADKTKGSGTVVESLGKVWLLTIEKAGWRPPTGGQRIAEIGPLPVVAGQQYSALFMEVIFNPGMGSAIHTHSGPEAWYNLAGENCLETPQGVLVARAGGPPVIVPAGAPMVLTTTGTEQRRGLTLILHDSSKPPTTMNHDWTPKGLCKVSPVKGNAVTNN